MSAYLDQLFGLGGKVAVVIGGTGELCGAMAGGLAGAGAEVVLVGRNADKAKARLDQIAATGGKAWFHAAEATSKAGLEGLRDAVLARSGRIDIVINGAGINSATPFLDQIAAAGGKAWFHAAEATSKAEVEGLRDAVLARSGRIDIVVNGAGINSATPFLDITEEEFDRIVRVNLKGVFLGCQVFGQYLVERGQGGSIINLGSMSGVVPLSRVFTYSATKGAVHNLSLNLAREWAPHRVRVNVLVPGFFPAEQNKQVLTPERVGHIMGHTPMQRFGEARELVGATLLLASDAAGSFITGEELIVDGGYHAMTI